MANSTEPDPELIVLELSWSASQFYEFALLVAEDAQIFAGAIELRGATLSPADAVRLFGRKLQDTARRLASGRALSELPLGVPRGTTH